MYKAFFVNKYLYLLVHVQNLFYETEQLNIDKRTT